jgi:glycosyltransferase involved in cell wall biosynthesis
LENETGCICIFAAFAAFAFVHRIFMEKGTMLTDRSLVTVLMPVFNGARFLREALDSVLAQTLKDFELLVIDGGSNDGTLDILNSIKDSRLRVISKRLNLIDSLNLGLEEARGRYIARMDADDIAEPMRLRQEVQFLDAHPEFVLVGSNARMIDADGKVLGRTYMPQASWWAQWCLFFACAFIHPSVMFPRRFVVEHGFRYGEIPAGDTCLRALPSPLESEDHLLWVRMSRNGHVGNLPLRLMRLRQHRASKSRANTPDVRTASAAIDLWNVSDFLGRPVPPADWWTDSSECNETTFSYWVNQLADVYTERKGLSRHQAAVIRQDVEFRIRVAAGRAHNVVHRMAEAVAVLARTTVPRTPDHWRSALRFIMGKTGYARLKETMRLIR